MNDKLTSHGSAIAAIVYDLHNLQFRPKPASSVNTHHPSMYQGVLNTRANMQSLQTVNDVILGHSTKGIPTQKNHTWLVIMTSQKVITSLVRLGL